MTGGFEVRYTDGARDDLNHPFDFLLERAKSVLNFEAAQSAIDNLRVFIEGHLARAPFIYRKAGSSPFRRELIIPFRDADHLVLYEIEGGSTVKGLAVRHQLEDGCH